MLTVAVIAHKGGVGKTTLALHLAVEAAKAGPAVIVDIDPQSSAAQWADSRLAKEPAVVACPPARLAVTLQDVRTVVLLRRQLSQEKARRHPYIRLKRGGRLPVVGMDQLDIGT